jgi:clathrin heavy chain
VGPGLQIFDLNKGANVNATNLEKEVPQLWKWIDPKTVAIVTNSAVHHWQIQEGTEKGELEKKFDRNIEPPLDKSAVISYHTDSSRDSHIVICYARAEDSSDVKGYGQLFHDGKLSRVEAHAATFYDFKSLDNDSSEKLLLTSYHTKDVDAKLVITSLTAKRPTQRSCPYKLQQADDWPVLIETIDRIGIVFVISKFGGLYMFDIESGTLIYKQRITTDSIFCGTKYRADPTRKMLEGVICVTKSGQVIQVQTDFRLLMSSLMRSNQQTVALRIATRMNLPNAEELYWTHFDTLKNKKNLKEAIELVAKSPKGILRTKRAMEGFASFADDGVKQYLQYLEDRGVDFNDEESTFY